MKSLSSAKRAYRAGTASLLIGLMGCYSYVPATGSAPTRGAQIRAQLATPADYTLTEVTVNNVVTVDAEVIASGTDTLVVSAMSLTSESGSDFVAAGESLFIPAGSIASLQERRFSLLRSSALVVAAGALATLVFGALGTVGADVGGGKPGPNPK